MRYKLLLFIVIVVLALHFDLNAQFWDWAKGGGADQGVDICSDRIGGLYVASTRANSPFMNYSMTYTQTGEIISRHDLNGNIIWAQKIISGNIAAISADRFGNCYATGSCNSATFTGAQGNFTVNHPGDYQAFTAKYDYSGNVQWVKFWDNPNAGDGGLCIKTDDFGNSVVAGMSSKSFYQGGPLSDFFLLKYDNQGSLLWNKTSNWKGTFGPGGIDIDNQGNIYVCGTFNDSACLGNITLHTSTYSSIFLAKYDKNGNLIWAKRAGTNYDGAAKIALDHKGSFFFTGTFVGPSTFGNITLSSPPSLGSCIFLAKYDTTGNCLWAVSSQKGTGVAVASDTSGNCFFTGQMVGPASFGTGPNTLVFNGPKGNQLFVIKYDRTGSVLWGVCPGGTPNGGNNSAAICMDVNGRCYITGGCEETTFGLITLTTTGVFIARIGPTVSISPANNGTAAVGVNELQSLQNSFSVYPNPTTGQIFVSFLNSNGLKNINLQVKNVVGQSIYEKNYDVNANEFVQEINLGHLPKGIYFVEVVTDKSKEVRKIILE